jgi:hypothetical protein
MAYSLLPTGAADYRSQSARSNGPWREIRFHQSLIGDASVSDASVLPTFDAIATYKCLERNKIVIQTSLST